MRRPLTGEESADVTVHHVGARPPAGLQDANYFAQWSHYFHEPQDDVAAVRSLVTMPIAMVVMMVVMMIVGMIIAAMMVIMMVVIMMVIVRAVVGMITIICANRMTMSVWAPCPSGTAAHRHQCDAWWRNVQRPERHRLYWRSA